MKSDDEQIKWQKAVIRDEWVEKQEQWEKVITEEWKCENCGSKTHGGYCDCMIVNGEFKGAWWMK